MTQKFKFGDRVRLRGGAFVFIFIAQQGSNDAAVICEGEAKAFSLPMQHLELIPHPDTARLDWLESQDNLRVTTLHSHSGVRGSPVEISYRIEKTDCVLMKNIIFKNFNTLRQAIDHAMQQEK